MATSRDAGYHRAAMWVRTMSCLMIAACSFQPLKLGGGSDAAPGDAATDCFQAWMDHTVQISSSAVKEISELSIANENSRNPWISADGLRMYFARDQGTTNTLDIYFTHRDSTAMPFGAPVAMTNLNSPDDEGRAWLTPDELTLVLSSDRGGPTTNILMATRTAGAAFGSPSTGYLTAVNMVGTERNDPFLSPDGLRLYLSVNAGPGGRFLIMLATRSSTMDDFGTPLQVPGTAFTSNSLGDPALYQGERLLVFSVIDGTGSADLWYATRASPTEPFGTAAEIPGVNSVDTEFDVVLGADGCDVYFASDRGSSNFHLFQAPITR